MSVMSKMAHRTRVTISWGRICLFKVLPFPKVVFQLLAVLQPLHVSNTLVKQCYGSYLAHVLLH